MRPHMCMCVLRLESTATAAAATYVGLGARRLQRFIEAQTHIHDDSALGGKRTLCAIGTHDLETVRCWSTNNNAASPEVCVPSTLLIDARPPSDVLMVPLKAVTDTAVSVQAVIDQALAETSHGGPGAAARKYATVLASLPRVPLLGRKI